MDRVIDRLDRWMEHTGKNDNRVTVECGLSIGLLNKARKGKSDIGKKAIEKILNQYQDINSVWLITGEGSMFKKDLKEELKKYEVHTNSEVQYRKIPVYELEATAGFSRIYTDFPSVISDYISIPNLPPVDGAIYARGDSMSPLIASGDIVVFKKVELIPENILWGHIYIISYSIDGDDYTVLKYIRHSSRDGFIRLDSFNSWYEPQDIPASSITALALVKASITFHTIG